MIDHLYPPPPSEPLPDLLNQNVLPSLPPLTALGTNMLPKLQTLHFPPPDPNNLVPSQTTSVSPQQPQTPQSAGVDPVQLVHQLPPVSPPPVQQSSFAPQPVFSQHLLTQQAAFSQPASAPSFSHQVPITQTTPSVQPNYQSYLPQSELRESTVLSHATLASQVTIPPPAPEAPAILAASSSVTVSPLSGARNYESPPCISPISTSNPPELYVPGTRVVALEKSTRIDDSLIHRLRGFSERPDAREPRIRDTTESLALDTCSERGELERPHACRKCSATFRRRDNLMAHIRAQHKGERPFKCEVCGFRFIKKDHAMKHWKVVHLKERPFVCNRCNSRFGQRSDLNKHVRSVHLRIKPFECEHCGLRFSHRGNQIRHQAVVHEKRKPYVCSECDSSFAEKSNLLKHCQAVHKNVALVTTRRELQ